MQRFLFPGFCTARSIKLQIQLTYSTPEKNIWTQKRWWKDQKINFLPMSHVIKVLWKFHVLDNTIPQKTKQIQTDCFWSYFYQDHANFYVYKRPNNKSNDMQKKISPMLDSSKKMKVLLAFSCFPTYTDSVLLPGFPLLYTRL